MLRYCGDNWSIHTYTDKIRQIASDCLYSDPALTSLFYHSLIYALKWCTSWHVLLLLQTSFMKRSPFKWHLNKHFSLPFLGWGTNVFNMNKHFTSYEGETKANFHHLFFLQTKIISTDPITMEKYFKTTEMENKFSLGFFLRFILLIYCDINFLKRFSFQTISD